LIERNRLNDQPCSFSDLTLLVGSSEDYDLHCVERDVKPYSSPSHSNNVTQLYKNRLVELTRLPHNLYCVGGDVKHCPI